MTPALIVALLTAAVAIVTNVVMFAYSSSVRRRDFTQIAEFTHRMMGRFDRIEAQLQSIEVKIGIIQHRLDILEKKRT